jgi:hypothetical protein
VQTGMDRFEKVEKRKISVTNALQTSGLCLWIYRTRKDWITECWRVSVLLVLRVREWVWHVYPIKCVFGYTHVLMRK